ncbi:MAG TPA: PAS domain-containing sensor histidine kinase [Chitinophagaceae bacterium]|nr:PAS domain-containing sensor histidine kinase [Chitinophagaceae bacterium]
MNKRLQKQVLECLDKTPEELPPDFLQLLNVISRSYNELEESNLELKTLFENMREAFFSVNIQANQMLQISKAAEVIWGYPPEDFYKNPNLWFELVIEEDKHIILANYPVMEAGIPFSHQYRIRHADGTIRWLESKITPTLNTDGKLVRIDGMTSDITASKQAETELYASERRFRQIVETAQEGIWTIDEFEKTNFVNKRICDMLEYAPEEMMGKELYDFMDEADKPYAYACMERRRNGAKETLDIRYLTKTGRHVWTNISANPIFDENGKYKGALAMITDITDRKRHEELLLKSEANLRTIFNNTESSYILLDKDLTVLSFNSIAQAFTTEIFKMQLEEGQNLLNYLPPDRKAVVLGVVEKVLAGEIVKYEVDYNAITGTPKWLYMQWVLTGALHDEKTGILFAVTDITEEKMIAEERDRITADLVQRNKDLQQFTYIVSHNLRAPVANIMGLANLLTGDDGEQPNKRTLLNALSSSVRNLDGIIKDLNLVLQVREQVNEKKEVIYFNRLADTIQASIANIITGQNVTLRYNFEETGSIFAIRSYLYSIFYNLISNSIKYRKTGVDPVITISSTLKDGAIELVFEDNGKGIDLSRYGKEIFGLYKRFDTLAEGKGLGLFMVKAHVENLGGTIRVESELNKGTTFTVTLPVDNVAARPQA